MKKTREKITFDISKEHKAAIKIIAAKRFMTLKALLSQQIARIIVEDNQDE